MSDRYVVKSGERYYSAKPGPAHEPWHWAANRADALVFTDRSWGTAKDWAEGTARSANACGDHTIAGLARVVRLVPKRPKAVA